MKDQTCAYCMREEKGELLDAFGIFICKLSVSDLILYPFSEFTEVIG